ncbi:MAG: hypothetical protein U5N58_02245 [Actinomycetota bacterium]|nr:hypothetical protein [Actinomycetota bacterium]
MGAIKQAIINIITTRPVSTIVSKASSDYIFSSIYIFLVGLTVIGIINLSLKVNRRSKKTIILINTILLVLLLLLVALANVLFMAIRGS